MAEPVEKNTGEDKPKAWQYGSKCGPYLSPTKILSGVITLVAALAWNQFAKDLVEIISPKGDGLFYKTLGTLIYAVLVTLAVLVIIFVCNRSQEAFISTPLDANDVRDLGAPHIDKAERLLLYSDGPLPLRDYTEPYLQVDCPNPWTH
jgi:hypothetical protein